MSAQNSQDLGQKILNYGGKVLKPYQVEGRDYLITNPRAGLWDDMGLGKTIQALAAAKDLGLTVAVVGPPKLKLDWEQEAQAVGVPLTYYSFAKIPDPGAIAPGSILIFEEAHWLQGGERTARGRKGLALAQEGRQAYVWLLTGTPMRNRRPINLKPMLEILGIVPGMISSWDYLQRFCGPRTVSVGRKLVTLFDGATDLKGLAQMVGPRTLRRKKSDVLDLPPKIRCHRSVPIEDKVAVRKALADFRVKLSDMLEDKGKSHLKPELEKLLIVSQLKLASEIDKVGYVVDLIEELEGQHSLIFCCYLESAKELATQIKCPLITGATDLGTRQRYIQEFQAGKHRAMVLTIRTAGVGITLTRASNVVFAGKEWAPEDNAQAEDRAYRIGQEQPLTVFDLESNLDAHVVNLHKAKDEGAETFLKALKDARI
jgi:SNF2 family DNA or RNA helicase